MAKVAINGMGRIGRAAFKVILETPELELVAINDLMPLDNLVYLLKYDTVYGRYDKKVEIEDNHLVVDGKKHRFFSAKDPAQLPWKELGIDIVFECTGVFTDRDGLAKHVQAGARYIILSAPPKGPDVCVIVPGVCKPAESAHVISCASCTTNCISPVVEVMGRRIGIKKAIMTTIHAYTATQSIVDGPNRHWNRGRAGAANFVPTTTGAAKATGITLPQYQGKFDGVAVRGPVPCGSLADIVFVTERETTVDEVNRIFKEESQSARYKDILGVAADPIVSSDIIKDPHASIVDLNMTQVVDGDLVKVMSWYDNEWGYTNQMIREAVRISKECLA
ncbi:MAG: type I glyceraldehyde-3-phosphate dehydrogenase [Deltaproteobacteria bacterium]|nr:type I glyceraldehyde-3-phosphate dehydrogenase [Deltaproteobacteria bacterium]MBW1952294.1 type I glyceraldehyde-3-phosphate dehydrogenase [Deltaproteobacteria bacterium]MBW1986010.1 type I glyceraldehyde-3-phosphate dehydrogenase [Deltaproteobacteria bacterium]MBW2134828.1 type I glyceraldehyde-3-phosphate dehydrogenase [Deltaproteobacteria bacterium]